MLAEETREHNFIQNMSLIYPELWKNRRNILLFPKHVRTIHYINFSTNSVFNKSFIFLHPIEPYKSAHKYACENIKTRSSFIACNIRNKKKKSVIYILIYFIIFREITTEHLQPSGYMMPFRVW